MAVRTHFKEKLEALANAVMRIAVTDSEDDVQVMFLHLVDRVTPSHLVALSYFENPHGWMEVRNTPTIQIEGGWIVNFDEAFTDFKGNRLAFYWTIQDLVNLGLLREKPDDSYRIESLLPPAPGAEPSNVKRERRAAHKEDLKRRNFVDIGDVEATELGKALLHFVSNPHEVGGRGAS